MKSGTGVYMVSYGWGYGWGYDLLVPGTLHAMRHLLPRDALCCSRHRVMVPRVLKSLARHMPFELAAGLNGAFWVDSGEKGSQTIVDFLSMYFVPRLLLLPPLR